MVTRTARRWLVMSALAIGAGVNLGCQKPVPERTLGYPYGRYEYVMIDPAGGEVARGQLHLIPVSTEPGQVQGRWDHDSRTHVASGVGLRGYWDPSATQMKLLLDPHATMQTTQLLVRLDGARMTGTWQKLASNAPADQGTIEAWRDEWGRKPQGDFQPLLRLWP